MFKISRYIPCYSSYFRNSCNIKRFSSEKQTVDYEQSPIKFSTSKAMAYKAKTTRMGAEDTRLWYEPYVILSSISVFLIYFCVLREENDIDKELNESLYNRVEGLEEVQLELSLKYNLDNGLDTTDIVQRLKEIREEKQRSKNSAH